ncbi:glycoside hydrolase [Cohnella sp. CFH 77786]|uniref:PfkB family carbohydrate kinase n=1 Tax=Cohnella sp. CFH 77786 TaxID=2662265 RepID=UPI001C611036|nr:PfkB family carbohydrate kinase [Cohnella sp. CFH 77786]MBW5445562.1 glycoside hydrolase [Cohnella sp. CFH 77786]
MFDVASLGEVLIDFTPDGSSGSGNARFEQNAGGAPANVLAALSKWGKRTAFIGKVGRDAFGRFLTDTLEACGIHTTGVVRTDEASTTLAFVHLDESGDRSFSFVRNPGADMLLTESDVDYSIVERSKIFHFGSISMTHEPAASATIKAAMIAKAGGTVVSFDPNLRIPLWKNLEHAKEKFRIGLTYADVLKISEEELAFITGTQDLVQGSQSIFLHYGVRIVLVTRAEKGCFVRKGDIAFSVPGFPAEAVDTTGSGDAFLGGFLYQLLERDCRIDDLGEDELYAMVRFSNAVGALVTTKKGAIPAMPALTEIGEIMMIANPQTKQDKYRPQFHFSPSSGWLNDPNGLVYFEGEYHLFYQHYPDKSEWGPMHWGHAVSKDLARWEHLPIAMAPDRNGMIFSGSVVVDRNDTSGFFGGGAGLVAVFTHADTYPGTVYTGPGAYVIDGKTITERPRQRQSLAYSKDKGRTWTMYEGNPVLADVEITDFRDPKVFWHEADQKWVMVLVAGDHVRFYASANLKEWTFTGKFGAEEGSHAGVWECPDLFELPVDGETGHTKWVLLVSIGDNPEYPEGSRTQYFIGHFDGRTFTSDLEPAEILWMDFGRDNYAAVTWSDVPEQDGRRLLIGWMSNWKYANQTPTVEWRSAMTIPRSLSLTRTAEGIRLISQPVEELSELRGEPVPLPSGTVVSGERALSGLSGNGYEIEAEFSWEDTAEFGLILCRSDREETVIGFETETGFLYIDRTRSGESGFHEAFPCKHGAALQSAGNRLKLRVFVDQSSVEVFADDGRLVLTDLIFPDPSSDGVALYSKGGDVKVSRFVYYPLNSIYADSSKRPLAESRGTI